MKISGERRKDRDSSGRPLDYKPPLTKKKAKGILNKIPLNPIVVKTPSGFSIIKVRNWDVVRMFQEAEKLATWLDEERGNVVWLENYALNEGYTLEDMEWLAENNEPFGKVFRFGKAVEKANLINKGLMGVIDSAMTRFVLINFHGLKNKAVIEAQGKDGGALIINLVERFIADPKDKNKVTAQIEMSHAGNNRTV